MILRFLFLLFSVQAGLGSDDGERELSARLTAFAQLAGYIQYFHPSQAALELDWDRFYWYGVSCIIESDPKDSIRVLNELFQPLTGEQIIFSAPLQDKIPRQISGNYRVWQHYGFGSKVSSELYKSKVIRVSISADGIVEPEAELFSVLPEPGTLFIEQIHQDFYCRFPFYAKDLLANDPQVNLFVDRIKNLQMDFSVSNKNARIASVMQAWNVFQHFHPYLEDRETFWRKILNDSLELVMPQQDKQQFLENLRLITAALNDGHAQVYPLDEDLFNFPPVHWQFFNSDLVVTNVINDEQGLKIGDKIQEINGVPAKEILNYYGRFVSGATIGNKKHGVAMLLAMGRRGSPIKIRSENRQIVLNRSLSMDEWEKTEGAQISFLSEKIAYIDLSKVSYQDFVNFLEANPNITGLIMDMRRRPMYNHQFLAHLTSKEIKSGPWFIPQIIYPNYKNVHLDRRSPWVIQPTAPRFSGRVAFLTGEDAFSYPESVLDIVKGYHLGVIVGRPTGGTNGNVNLFQLRTGYSIGFTGMFVLAHNGTGHHGIGIIPDIHVKRSIRAIKAGRDEDIEAAMDWMSKNKKSP